MTGCPRTAVLGLLLVACNVRPAPSDDAATLPVDVGASEPGETDSESAGGVTCREGLTACDGECVDLSSNDQHCGVCGHACRLPFRYGHCEEGSCPSSADWCASIEWGLDTCDEVCAYWGQRCDEGPRALSRGCGGWYKLHFADFTVPDALEACVVGVGSHDGVEATCSTPFDWSIHGGWDDEPAEAVSCCCTQEPRP